MIMLLGLLVFALNTQAQIPASAQKQMEEAKAKLKALQSNPEMAQKMQMAQHVMDSLKRDSKFQKQLAQQNSVLDSLKKAHPEMGDVQIPDLNNLNAGMPDMDSLSASLSQQMNNAQNKMAAIAQFKEQFKPKANPLHHVESLATLKKASVIAFTQATLNKVASELGMAMKDKLDKVVKNSTLNVAGTGLFYLSLNLSPKEASAYLICKGILLHPGDPYAINALGVYCRDNNDLQNALRLFLYADALLPDSIKSPYIYANIGWASFYYGDFGAGQKYFDKSLALSSAFKPALEGEAMIAYAKGDIKALFKCLAKELLANTKYAGGAGGGGNIKEGDDDGPSDFFTDIAATEYIQSVRNLDDQPDPTQDHSFDNFAVEEPDDGAADDVDVSYKVEAKPIFNVTPKTLAQAKGDAGRFMQKAFNILQPMAKKLTQQLSGLTPLASTTTMDNTGNITISKSYRKYVDIIAEIHQLFERRVYWFRKKYNKEYKPFPLRSNTDMQDKINLFFKASVKCAKDNDCSDLVGKPLIRCNAAREECEKEAACKWYPALYGECNSDIETAARIWNKYWDNIFKTIQWYIDATNPLIRKVHDAGWNNYLNNERTTYIRQTVLGAYSSWAAEVLALPEDPYANKPIPSCPVKMAGIATPDPFSKKPKHIKEFADPNCKDMDFPIGIAGSITENCHYTKFTIGPKIGPIQLGFTYTTNKDWTTGKVKDNIYSKNNDFDHGYGATAGITYKFDDVVEVGASAGGTVNYNDKGQATGYTGSGEVGGALDFGIAKLGGKATSTWQMNADGNITGHSNSLSGSASIGGDAPTKKNDPNQNSSGFGAGGDYTTTSNYDANGNYIGGKNSATVSLQQSGTTGNGNKKVASQNNVFGVQFNQVIQVVATKQATPFTAQ